ncbi:uncharacterized protein LOC109545313 isoform X2 [Dendroctonus ponderosae]
MNQYVFYDFEGRFPRTKRNFIKENVKSIKQMQGILQEAGVIQPRKRSIQGRYRNVPQLSQSRESTASRSLGNLTKTDAKSQATEAKPPPKQPTSIRPQPHKAAKVKQPKRRDISTPEDNGRLTHRGMQTEREEDMSRLYDTGVIKYPSPSALSHAKKPIQGGQGDQPQAGLSEDLENLTFEDKDFIKENKTIKTKPPKQSPVKVLAQAPPSYQRGVVPKYLRDRKDDAPVETDADCPPGHILLPEEERKETLRVLRQSYADRIQELNMMPVRNDTLKMKKRKMDIEEELKRIDGGIKVFQRPKVYVKINA